MPEHEKKANGEVDADGDSEENNLIVNYIPPHLSEVNLRDLFLPYGTIVSCKLIMDKVTGTKRPSERVGSRAGVGVASWSAWLMFFFLVWPLVSTWITPTAGASAGWGFVRFATVDGAHKALSALNGLEFGGKTLKVSISRPRGVEPVKFVPRKHCSHFAKGSCSKGATCTFLHVACELDAACPDTACTKRHESRVATKKLPCMSSVCHEFHSFSSFGSSDIS